MFRILIVIVSINLLSAGAQDILCLDDNGPTKDCDFQINFLKPVEKVILAKACEDNQKLFAQASILTMRGKHNISSIVKSKCDFDAKATVQLAWLSHESYLKHFNDIEVIQKNIIAKTSPQILTRLTFCSFDLNQGNCGGYLEDQHQIKYKHDIYFLVQLLPVSYIIFDVNYKLWSNVNNLAYLSPMGNIILKNTERTAEKIYDTIRYGFNEKIHLNISQLDVNQLKGQFELNGVLVNVSEEGTGNINRKKDFTFSRILPPQSLVNVSLMGNWAEHYYEFSAKLQLDYGSKYIIVSNLNETKILVTKIINPETKFSKPVSLVSGEILADDMRNINDDNNSKYDDDDQSIAEAVQTPLTAAVYPQFYPFFVMGVLVISIVLIVAIYGIWKTVMRERAAKNSYKQVSNRVDLEL